MLTTKRMCTTRTANGDNDANIDIDCDGNRGATATMTVDKKNLTGFIKKEKKHQKQFPYPKKTLAIKFLNLF